MQNGSWQKWYSAKKYLSPVGVLKGPKGLEKFASIFMAGGQGEGFSRCTCYFCQLFLGGWLPGGQWM